MARHVLGLDHEFHRTHTPGELIQRVDGDVTSVSDFLGRVVPRLVGAVTMVVGMIVVLAVVDWRLAVGAAVYVGIAAALRRARPPPGRRRVERRDGLLRPPVRRHRGTAHRVGGPPRQRRRSPRDVAVRRRERRRHAQLGAPRDGLPAPVVGRAGLGGDRRRWCRSWPAPHWWPAAPSPSARRSCCSSTCCCSSARWRTWSQQLETVQKANGAMVRVIDLLAVAARRSSTTAPTMPAAGPLERRSCSTSASTTATGKPVLSDHRPHARRRPVDRHRRPHRQRQDHAVAPGAAPGRGHDRRCCGCSGVPIARHPAGDAAPAGRPRSPRRSSCSRAPSATTSRCSTRRPPTPQWRRHCAHAGLGALVDGGIHRAARCRRRRALGRRGPAAGAGQGVAARPRPGGARRGDRPRRPGDRGTARRRRRRADARAHDAGHRPSAVARCATSTRSSCSTTVGSSSTATATTLADDPTVASTIC